LAFPWLNRVDIEWLRQNLHGTRHVVTIDNHYVDGGQGAFLASQMARHGLAAGRNIRCLGVTEVPHCGRNDEVLQAHGLDARSLATLVTRFLLQAA
jgi:transketolase